MRMIGDFSSLIFLSALGLPDILRIKFGEVLIPEAVYQEVTAANLKRYDEVKEIYFFVSDFSQILSKKSVARSTVSLSLTQIPALNSSIS